MLPDQVEDKPSEHVIKKELFTHEFQQALEVSLLRYNLHPWVYTLGTDALDILNREGTPFANAFTFTEFLQQAVHPNETSVYIGKLEDFLVESKVNPEAVFEVFPTMIAEHENFEKLDVFGIAIEKDENGNVLKMAGIAQLLKADSEKEVKMRKIKEMLELSLQASGIVPWEFDLENRLIYAPESLPLSPDCTLPLEDYAKIRIEKEFQELFLTACYQIIAGEKKEINIKVKALVSETNTIEWVNITGKSIEMEREGRKITGAFQVITKEVEREQELIALRKAAEESNRLKTAFLANMSHEIRTPLNAIVGFSQLMAITTDKEEIEQYNQIIAMNNDLLLRLINDILDIAKIESEQMDFLISEIDLGEIFQQLYYMYENRMPEGVVLLTEFADGPLALSTEKNRMVQVVSNFLNNAIKFTSSGSITMGYADLGDFVRIYVRDTGRGIAEEDVDKVFDRFVKLNYFVQGTGLGLAISQVIIQRLGGQIGVESEEGKGSEFWFTLPKENNQEPH